MGLPSQPSKVAIGSGRTNGDAAVRCIYMGNSSALVGFTLRLGATRNAGIDAEQMGGCYIREMNE